MGSEPLVSYGSLVIIGEGREQLAQALEDHFGRVGRPSVLAWLEEPGSLRIKLPADGQPVAPGWRTLTFVSGPGAFATRAMHWLARKRLASWKLSACPGSDEVVISPL